MNSKNIVCKDGVCYVDQPEKKTTLSNVEQIPIKPQGCCQAQNSNSGCCKGPNNKEGCCKEQTNNNCCSGNQGCCDDKGDCEGCCAEKK